MIESEILLNLSDNLCRLLKGTGTICDMAERIGVHRSELWRYMNCRAIPKTLTLVKLAEELDVTIDWLISHHSRG